MQTSQGYIFCILQHFVTKFCNFIADFNKFFTGIYFFLPKSKISLTCKLSIIFLRISWISKCIETVQYLYQHISLRSFFPVHVEST
jgi:hypothetical protein